MIAKRILAAACIAAAACSTGAFATVATVSDSALVHSGQYYTDDLGNVVVMTGGGNAANVGDPSGRNDDGYSGPIDLGFTLNFFGQDYTQFWANNNGNISFTGGISSYTPAGPQGASVPIISPFFADVDTRGANSGVMYLNTSIPNEVIITWDGVGYFGEHDNLLDSFQLVLRGPGFDIPDGEGSIGFFYKSMQWETGDASGGSGGFGGTPAAVGFGDGQGNGEVLEGSIQNGISGIVNNNYIWFYQNLTPVTPPGNSVPEPSELPLMLLGLLGMGTLLYTRRRRQTV